MSKDRGLFRRRGSPHWWMRYADRNGRIIRESSGTSVKKLAKEILAKKRTLVVENRHLDVKKVPKTTFYELCDEYWELWGQSRRMKGLENMLKIWKQELGNPCVKDLTPQKIEQFLSKYGEKKGLTGAARNRHLTMLRAVFNKGINWGLVAENPTMGIAKLRENGARTRFLDQNEIKRLLEKASKEFRSILITALHSGMRRGEIFKLKWKDVDLGNRIITVQESKSGKKRMIPIDDTLYETLRLLPSRFKKGLVFPSPRTDKEWVDLKKQFKKTKDAAEIDEVRFHDLRHTFASHLVMNGVDLKTVQELLGHSSLTMTMRYSHLAPDHRLRAIKTLDTAYQTDTKTDTVGKAGESGSS